ncbi:hypothetical protein [Athalassotoga saccharophila]|uniref:hypothetical protein n=1 Tax=Athalassotoga saccharophila TaxID=1441386 RepID=UPI00137946E9|nr:hypothetical protein [Athalassotoga saccharophila]BBJ27900.1 hypothetical protein ATHSA_0792 [Athalassotoga saccharophila]
MDKENFDLRFILLIISIVIGLVAIIWAGVLTSKISNFDQKIAQTQTSVASMTSYVASTTASLNDQIAKIEKIVATQSSTIASLTSYVKNMYADLSAKILSEDQKISTTQSNLSALSNQVGSLISNLQSLTAQPQTSSTQQTVVASSTNPLMSLILGSAPSLNPSVNLLTTTATSLSGVSAILSGVTTYEITKSDGIYYIAYPGKGTTYSIQILSSPYPDRVLALVNALRNIGIPAFKIDYSNLSALFIGVFTGYNSALSYANSISANPAVTSIVQSTVSSWLIRQIP